MPKVDEPPKEKEGGSNEEENNDGRLNFGLFCSRLIVYDFDLPVLATVMWLLKNTEPGYDLRMPSFLHHHQSCHDAH